MTREDIIRMAREAGLVRTGDKWTEPARWGVTEIERFAALVIAAEREACAKVCYVMFDKTGLLAALQLSDKIRARGNT